MPTIYRRKCDYCGKHYERHSARFCSRECWRRWFKKENTNLWKGGSKTRCGICGKITPKTKNKFCSRACYNIAHSHRIKQNPNVLMAGIKKVQGKTARDIEWVRVLKEAEELKKQGFRVIPIAMKCIPDIIAIKDNKVFAVEVEYNKPNYAKYTDEIRQFYDDIIWILKKKWRGE